MHNINLKNINWPINIVIMIRKRDDIKIFTHKQHKFRL